MSSITSANAAFILIIPGLGLSFQVQGFDVDDAFTHEPIEVGEERIGVDGNLSYGFTYQATPLDIVLSPDSGSVSAFEAWYSAELQAQDKYPASGNIRFPSLGRSYSLNNGILRTYSPMAGAKKLLQPRRFRTVWQSIIGRPLAIAV